jgi:hypothetical protein
VGAVALAVKDAGNLDARFSSKQALQDALKARYVDVG